MYFPSLGISETTGEEWEPDNICSSHSSEGVEAMEDVRRIIVDFQSSNPLTVLEYCRVVKR